MRYHYLYKTTCLLTNKFYIGVHSTTNLNDNYMGSGVILRYSRLKHGDHNHAKEILCYCNTREELLALEKQIVTEELLQDPLCMNLKRGGHGGWDHNNKPGEQKGFPNFYNSDVQRKCSAKRTEKLKNDPVFKHRCGSSSSRTLKLYVQEHGGLFKDKKHTEATKKKIGRSNSEKQLGTKNSQYGTRWVNNGSRVIKVSQMLLDDYLQKGWVIGRKFGV